MEVAEAHALRQLALDKLARRAREEDLAPVGGGADARGLMHPEPVVSLLGHHRLSGMETHAHQHLNPLRPFVRRERALALDDCGDRVLRPRKGHEEGIALRVDLAAVMRLEGRAQKPAVLREHVPVRFAELFDQPRRALDIREQKSDRAGREARHAHRVPPCSGVVKTGRGPHGPRSASPRPSGERPRQAAFRLPSGVTDERSRRPELPARST